MTSVISLNYVGWRHDRTKNKTVTKRPDTDSKVPQSWWTNLKEKSKSISFSLHIKKSQKCYLPSHIGAPFKSAPFVFSGLWWPASKRCDITEQLIQHHPTAFITPPFLFVLVFRLGRATWRVVSFIICSKMFEEPLTRSPLFCCIRENFSKIAIIR